MEAPASDTSDASPSADDVKSKGLKVRTVSSVVASVLYSNLLSIERGISPLERESTGPRQVARAIRSTLAIRRKLSREIVSEFIATYFVPEGASDMLRYLRFEGEPEFEAKSSKSTSNVTKRAFVFETKVFCHLVVLIVLLDASSPSTSFALLSQCAIDLIALVQSSHSINRSVHPLIAKAFFYYAFAMERVGKLNEIRGGLMRSLSTATLHHDCLAQATLVCAILRSYLESRLYRQAFLFLERIDFPDIPSNHLWARFLYYRARVSTVMMNYVDGYKDCMNALRKGPSSSSTVGIAFRVQATRLLVLIQLLLGDIPDRYVLESVELRAFLHPYKQLVSAVRVGDLSSFNDVLALHKDRFEADKNLLLVSRLRSSVIRTGLRKLNIVYSSISLEDISRKLKLPRTDDVELIVAKAILDGVLDATIDPEKKVIHSNTRADLYSTLQPVEAFDKRISFCLELRDETVKALRYPDVRGKDSHDPDEMQSTAEMAEEQEALLRELEEDDDE